MEPADTWGGERGRKSEGEKERAREAERVAKKEGGQEWNEEKLVNERESDSLTCQSTQSGNRGATERGGIIEATIRLPLPPLRSFQPLYRSSCRAPTLRSLPFFLFFFLSLRTSVYPKGCILLRTTGWSSQKIALGIPLAFAST